MRNLLDDFLLTATGPAQVAKFRELILQLAVLGKLVEQPIKKLDFNSCDDLVRNSKNPEQMAKANVLDPLHHPSSAFTLPPQWKWVCLDSLSEIIRGITFPANEKSKTKEEGRVACLRTTNVQDKITWEDLLYIRTDFVKRQDQFLKKNDIVMSIANSKELVGKVALVEETPAQLCSFGGFLSVLRSYKVNPKYLMIVLRSPYARQALIDSASQTTNIANISVAKLRPFMVPLPPPEEQQKIIEKVETAMLLCDHLETQLTEADLSHKGLVEEFLNTLTGSRTANITEGFWKYFDELFYTESSLKALKDSIVQLGVLGKLDTHNINDQPAAVPKAKPSTKELGEANNKKNSAIQIKNTRDAVAAHGKPEGWVWTTLGNVCRKITDGTHHTPTYITSGIPFLSVKDLSSGRMNFSNTRFISEAEHVILSKRCNPERGDILLTKVGTTGIAVLVDTDIPFSIFVSVALLKVNQELYPPYMVMLLNSPFVKEQSAIGTEGVGNKNLVLRKISDFHIPIPPRAEQIRIVERVNILTHYCDQIESKLRACRQIQLLFANEYVTQALRSPHLLDQSL